MPLCTGCHAHGGLEQLTISQHKQQIVEGKKFSQTPLAVDSAQSYRVAQRTCTSSRQSETAETIAHVFQDLGLKRIDRTSEFKLTSKSQFYRLLKLLGNWAQQKGTSCRALGATQAPHLKSVDIRDIRKAVSDVMVYKQALCDESLAMARLSEARGVRTNPTVRSKQPLQREASVVGSEEIAWGEFQYCTRKFLADPEVCSIKNKCNITR